MNKFISLTAIYAALVALGILVLMYGWGLEPKSWGWIIGGNVVVRIGLEVFNNLVKAD